MPEGDTIHRLARILGRDLPGRTLDLVVLRGRGEVSELAGRRVGGVDALGKHLLIHLEGGWTLRFHLGMNGRWRRLHARERRPRNATALLAVGDTVYVCERAYQAEAVRTAALRSHPRMARLGPDLLADPPDVQGAVRRASLAAHANREIGDLLIDQRIAAGIGNIYKSEVLFACRVHPRTRVRELLREQLTELYDTAARLMRQNLATRRRTSVPLHRRPGPSSPRLWVYGRKGKKCLECGSAVEQLLQGDRGRGTYFCPTCQGEAPRRRRLE